MDSDIKKALGTRFLNVRFISADFKSIKESKSFATFKIEKLGVSDEI